MPTNATGRELGFTPWNDRGISLVEVIVSLAILTIAIMGLLAMLSSNIKVNEASANITAATILANRELETRLTSARDDTSLADGATVSTYDRDMVSPPVKPGLYQVTVTVGPAGVTQWPKRVTATVQSGDILGTGGRRTVSVSTIVKHRSM